ncbi:hypothetical protein [Streptomyces anulatus]|uniref:hypothetical protein n=1 Tax=Streptomyces anulatus TaxID=1892 RepID=UPI00386F6909|nr:hypothetical protein OG536_33840 [Streptomyces anulatus]
MDRDRKQLLVLVLAVLLVALPFVGALTPASAVASPSAEASSTVLIPEDGADVVATCGDAESGAASDAWPAGRDRHRPVAAPDRTAFAGSIRGDARTALSAVDLSAPYLVPRAASAAPSASLQVFRC